MTSGPASGLHVAFRVDASARIGSGHLARCLALADEFAAAGARSLFITRCDSDAAGAMILARGHDHTPLPYAESSDGGGDAQAHWLGLGWERDAEDTGAELGGSGTDVLVVDSYGLDARWERALRPRAKLIAAVDDTADRPHAVDLLLDQNLHPDMPARYRDLVPSRCRMLLGPSFAVLRPEFAKARARAETRSGRLESILVCFGGSDPARETFKALDGIAGSRLGNLRVTVVAGAFNAGFADLAGLCAVHPGWVLHRHVDFMADLMADADLAIGAGGATTWERCCLGLPALATVLAPNQEATSFAVAEAGAQQVLGRSRELSARDYVAALDRLRPETLMGMSRAGSRMVDGKGCSRVLSAILE